MFAPSPSGTPLQGAMETPEHMHQGHPLDSDLDPLPPAAVDCEGFDTCMDLLPPAAVDSEGLGYSEDWAESLSQSMDASSEKPSSKAPGWFAKSPPLSAEAAPFSFPAEGLPFRSPALSADAPPFSPATVVLNGLASKQQLLSSTKAAPGLTPQLSPEAAPWYPPSVLDGTSLINGGSAIADDPVVGGSADESAADPPRKSWASIAASAPVPKEVVARAAKQVEAAGSEAPVDSPKQPKSWAVMVASAPAKKEVASPAAVPVDARAPDAPADSPKKPMSWAAKAAAPPAPKEVVAAVVPPEADASEESPKKPKSWAAMAASQAPGAKAGVGTPKLGVASPKTTSMRQSPKVAPSA